MDHGFLILTHLPPERIFRQVSRLQAANHYFFIHFDMKLVIDPNDTWYRQLSGMANVTILAERMNVLWGGFRTIGAMLLLLRKGLENKGISYFHMMTGECHQVKPAAYIDEFFRKNEGNEYLQYFVMPHKASHGLTYDRLNKYHLYDHFNRKSVKPADVIIRNANTILRVLQRVLKKAGAYRRYPAHYPVVYAGSVYWSLTYAACEYLVQYTNEHPAFYNRFRFTQSADEMYFQTILMNSRFAARAVNNNLRFINFKGLAHSPTPVTMDHLPDILRPDVLFARKFTPESKELLDYLDKNVY